MGEKKKNKMRRLALFLCMALFLNGLPVVGQAAERETLTQVDGMSYFEEDAESFSMSQVESGFQMNLYSDFERMQTYVPFFLWMRSDSNLYKIPYGEIENWNIGDWDDFSAAAIKRLGVSWTGWNGNNGKPMIAYGPINNIVYGYNQNIEIDESIKTGKLKIFVLSPNEQDLYLKEVQGYYNGKDRRIEGFAAANPIQVGFNKSGEIQVPDTVTGGAIGKLKYAVNRSDAIDRAFVSVSESGYGNASYQMKMEGNWVLDKENPIAPVPAEDEQHPAAGVYQMTVSDDLKAKWNGQTESGFDWSDISVQVEVGYLVKDYGSALPAETTMVKAGSTVNQLIEQVNQMYSSTNVTFYSGFPEKDETWQKEMGISWALSPESYGGKTFTGDTVLRHGDEIHLIMNSLGDEYVDVGEAYPPEMVITISASIPDVSDNNKGGYVYESDYKYITKYHQKFWNYYAFPGQTYEDVGLPKTIDVDYYTSNGEVRTENVKIKWTLVEENKYPLGSKLHPYTMPADSDRPGEPGFNGLCDVILLYGQVDDEDGMWRHAPGKQVMSVTITLAKRWLNLDISEFTQETYLVVENGKLLLHLTSAKETYYEGWSTKYRFTDEHEYDMSKYTGIRLYTSKEEYPLKTVGAEKTFLTIKGEHVNLWLDDVEIKMQYADWRWIDPQPLSLITLYSNGEAKTRTADSPKFVPHYVTGEGAGWVEVGNLWYPDMGEWEVDTSLIIHCSGKNILDNVAAGGPAISVPYDTMLAIGSDPRNKGGDLTAIGSKEAVAIGDARACGFVYIHDVELNLGRTDISVGGYKEIALLGSKDYPNYGFSSSLKSMLSWYGKGERPSSYNPAGVRSRPIVISGWNAVVAPVYPEGKWLDELRTVGALTLYADSQLIIKDGAVLKTSSNYLPPAYSIVNAWYTRGEHPYKNASIVFNYLGGDKEHTVTFDEEGKVLISGNMQFEVTSSGTEETEFKVVTEFSGLYPSTRLDFMFAGQNEMFGPVSLQVEGEERIETSYLYSMKDSIVQEKLNTEAYIKGKLNDGWIRIYEEVDNDLYKTTEPIIGTYQTNLDTIVRICRFPTKDDFKTASGQGISATAEKLMRDFGVNEEDMLTAGLDVTQEIITLSRGQRDHLFELGVIRLIEERNKSVKLISNDNQNWTLFAAEYRVTSEDLLELGIDISRAAYQVTDELVAEVQRISAERIETYEKEVLNGQMYMLYGDSVPIQHWQFVDKYAPSLEELEKNHLAKYLYAEVSRMVDGQEEISYELIPVTWKEDFLSGDIWYLLKNSGEPIYKRYTAGYATGLSYATDQGVGGKFPGEYMFSAVLPYGYVFDIDTASPIVEVNVIESEETKKYKATMQAIKDEETPLGERFVKIPDPGKIQIDLVFDDNDRKADMEEIVTASIGAERRKYNHITFTFIEEQINEKKSSGNFLFDLWNGMVAGPLYDLSWNFYTSTRLGRWIHHHNFHTIIDLIISPEDYFAGEEPDETIGIY